MKKVFYRFLPALLIGAGMVSCSDNDPENNGDGDGSFGGGSGSMEQMSPAQSKEFLSDAAREAMNLLNPNDQKELLQLIGYFIDTYGDYDLPPNFYLEDDEDNFIYDYFRSLGKSLMNTDLLGLSRAYVDYVYDIDFNLFKGVYAPGYYEWVQTGESNDVIFIFNYNGQKAEIKAKGSSNSYNTSMEWTEEDWWYGDETTQFNFKVPAEVVVTVTLGNKELANVKVVSNVSFENHKFNVEVNGNVANIGLSVKTSGTDSKVTETSKVTVSGKEFVVSDATLNGKNLCNIDFYQRNANDEEELLSNLISNGNATVGVIGKVYVDGKLTYIPGIFNGYDDYDELETKAYLEILKRAVKGQVRYNNTTTVQAEIGWTYTKRSYSNWYGTETYYEIEPLLLFPDGSSYYFEGYFQSGFSSIENAFDSLIRKYQSVMESY